MRHQVSHSRLFDTRKEAHGMFVQPTELWVESPEFAGEVPLPLGKAF
jgi:hypothetical protein